MNILYDVFLQFLRGLARTAGIIFLFAAIWGFIILAEKANNRCLAWLDKLLVKIGLYNALHNFWDKIEDWVIGILFGLVLILVILGMGQ